MESAKLHVEGPFTDDGSKNGPDISFFLAEEASDEAETDTKPQDIPTQNSEDTILAPLQGNRSVRWSGIANGHRLHHAGYGSDAASALIEWLIHAESLISPEQGQGYKITDETRGETLEPGDGSMGILFQSFRWTYEAGNGVEAEWSIEGKVNEGMQKAGDRQEYIDEQLSARGSIDADLIRTENGSLWPLGELSQRQYERSIDLNTMDMVHQQDVPAVGIAESGVKGELMLDGRLSRNDANLKRAARRIADDFHGVTVTFEDALTGREFTGAIGDTSTTFEAGTPDILEYRVEIREGHRAETRTSGS